MRRVRAGLVLLAVASLLAMGAAGGAPPPQVAFHVFARTGLRLADIQWTGQRFLYVENTSNRVAAAGPAGMPLTAFATMPRQVEETRCRLSPGAHGFAAGYLYCHSPDNKIYRISPDGKAMTVLATLPEKARSDGALAFDTVGAFGYALIAATGRSGAATPGGGAVYTIDAHGGVQRVGNYHAAGGADEIVVAPRDFGSAGGQVLLGIDAGRTGSLMAMDAHGAARTLLALSDGPNPLVVLARGTGPAAGAAPAGLYITDTRSRAVYLAPSAALAPFRGAVLVGSELGGLIWVIRPRGDGFTALRLRTNLAGSYNFEGAAYLAP